MSFITSTAGLLSGSLEAAGGLFKGVGSIGSGYASANAADYNAEIARQSAANASEAGQSQATVESLKGADVLGNVKASQAANNIDVDSGSALKVQQGARAASVYNTESVENNALLAAYGYKNTAALDTEEAQEDITAGYIGAGGDVLTGASSLAGPLAAMQNPANDGGTAAGDGGYTGLGE
jgi:hypothetical protein